MAPKKKPTKAAAPKASRASAETQQPQKEQEAANNAGAAPAEPEPREEATHPPTQTPSTKTKKTPTPKRKRAVSDDDPNKAPRRSARTAARTPPTQHQLLTYLLGPDAIEIARPADERRDLDSRSGRTRTYSGSELNPFEELLCAVILSRPISHMLGLRTIRTILNEPYNFTSARTVREAGTERRHQAVWDAKTQHKDKTAEEIGLVAEVVLDKFTSEDDEAGSQMGQVRKESGGDMDKMHELLKSSIKGLGKTGLEIFFRRVQWLWTEVYPFVDGKSAQALQKLGLPQGGEELMKALEGVDTGSLDAVSMEEDEAMRKRRAFVTVLERVTGADLEGKIEAVANAATEPEHPH